jgi:transcriptional regulator with XRE-family HTH domain/tetratricopeptide (TPR) repeat protein
MCSENRLIEGKDKFRRGAGLASAGSAGGEGDAVNETSEQASTFGKLLLSHRRAAGLSQARLAEASGISVRALRELERGRAQAAQQRSAEVLAEGLGLAGSQRELFLAVAREGRRRGGRASKAAALCAPPPDVRDLAGREADLARVRAAASDGGIVAIVGQPGVGKTTLAVAAAHRLRADFPDGCLWLDLRGMDGEPVAARDALGRLLRALGVASEHIPFEQAEQVALFRMLLADRRVLVVLDNAVDEAHVRPLLAAGNGSLTLVTCRQALAGLAGARWLWLDPLESTEAIGLLSGIAGADRVRAESTAAAELVELCGFLPLALRIAGNRLVTRPHWSLEYVVSQLRDERTRLTSLSAGDLQLRPAFEVSYRRLSPAARLVFRRLAALPGPDFGAEVAAIATELSEPDVRAGLDELADANLIQVTSVPGRFQFHDLIRIFAAERLEAEEPAGERDKRNHALLEYLLGTAASAAKLFFPDAGASGRFAGPDDAAEWLEKEAGNWTAAQRAAAGLGWHRAVIELARSMHWYSDSRWLHGPWDRIFGLGVEAARASGGREDLAVLLNFLGWAQQVCLGDDEAALVAHREALAVALDVGNRREQVWARAYLGTVLMRLGHLDAALGESREACSMAGDFDFWEVELSVRLRLGRVLRELHRYEEAITELRTLVADVTKHEDEVSGWTRRRPLALITEVIGHCLSGLRRWWEAAETFHEARMLFVRGDLASQAGTAALHEGIAWRNAGEYGRARESLEVAAATEDTLITRRPRERALAELALLPADAP